MSQVSNIIITDVGVWMVGPNIMDRKGWMKSMEKGLDAIPHNNWMYLEDSVWHQDQTLKFEI